MCLLRRLLPLLALLALASCGGGASSGGGGGDDPDPAEAMPANVALYVEGTVRPEGDTAEAIDALAAKFGIDDPGRQLVDYLEAQSDEDDDTTYEADVKPWLGRRAAIGLDEFDGDDAPFYGVVDVTDAKKAEAYAKKSAGGGKALRYKDTSYWRDRDGGYAGVAGDYLVLASDEARLRRVVDRIDSGEGSLADDDRYGDATGDLPDERVGTFYANAETLVALAERGPAVTARGLAPIVEETFGGVQSVAGALTPHENRAVLEIQARTKPDAKVAGLLAGLDRSPGIVKDAPADALGVLGLADVGKNAKAVLNTFAGALGGAALRAQARGRYGIDLDADLFSWIGDSAVFVRGTSAEDLNGALMVDATDEQAAARALPKLVGVLLQQAGIPLRARQFDGADQAWEARVPGRSERAYVARSGTRVVIGYGEEATRMALQPSSSLDANGSYDRAKQAVDGLDPFAILDAQKLVALAERYAGDDADLRRAKPYLEPLAQLVLGSSTDGDTQTSRIAVTVG